MEKAEIGRSYLHRMLEDLREVSPCLLGQGSFSENVRCLADFIQKFFPISILAMARMDTTGSCREIACPDAEIQDEILRFFKDNEDFLRVPFSYGGEFDSESLSQRLALCISSPIPSPALLPIRYETNMIGLALFARTDGLEWSLEDSSQLRRLMDCVAGLSLFNKSVNNELNLQNWVFNGMMDNMDTNLYVTDIETDQILFMNRKMKETFGISHPEGQICWKVFQKGMTQRCAFCPVEELKNSSEKSPSCIWEEENTLTGRTYENYDSLMPWIDGSMVHFQQSMDITESKRLSRLASIDELTEMLNRRAGKEALSAAIERARSEKVSLTVCMYDVNMLKNINDTYGHSEGDFALAALSQAIRSHMRPGDIPFRLSGDEFISVFYNADEKYAAEQISNIRRSAQEAGKERGKAYELDFCCGIVEIGPEERATLDGVLTLADAKMYEQKKRYRTDLRELLRSGVSSLMEDVPFQYDKEHLYEALVRSTDDYVYVANMEENIFCFPPNMVNEFDLPGEIIHDATTLWASYIHPDDRPSFVQSIEDIMMGRTNVHNVEYRVKNRSGEWVWVRCRGYVIRDERDRATLFAGIMTNLGKKNKVDPLTGLFNKFAFQNDIERLIELRSSAPMGIMLLGVDDFKHINDLYDRDFGDGVLRVIAQKIQALLPGSVTVYRLDGDEYGLICYGADQPALLRYYEMIQSSFRYQQEYNGQKYFCTLSAGCSLFPQDAGTYLDLFKFASYSLEYAKNSGKNHLCVFSREILEHKEKALEMTELLRASMEQGYTGFSLYYQPQVDARTRRIVGAEALARWSCPKYGPVPPDVFIPLLEDSGMILPTGRWIFRQAAETCARWLCYDPNFTMSINLSRLQLKEEGFIEFMGRTIEEFHIPPQNIVVELTEGYIAANIDRLKDIFEEIRGLGLRIAMDDFGTGYSSLEILKCSPADIVKIDRAFVQDILTSRFDATFIEFIVALCHDVGIQVCLEGVETEEEYAIVRSMHLDQIQGYLFGKPLPPEDFERWL